MEENKKLVQFIFNENREVVVEKSVDNIKRLIRSYDLWASESEPEKTWYHYASDEQGSTIFITDEDKICNKYDYDAWGNLTTCEEIIPNRYLYTGQQFDQITQQYYLRARYYNPVIARFTQEDIYRGDGLNLYTYCDNNPVIYYDPSGYAACNGPTSKNPLKKELEAGDADYKGTLPEKSWKISDTGEGAHLFEKVNLRNRDNLAKFNKKDTPRYYPYGGSKNAGQAHIRLHNATKKAGIKLQGGNPNKTDAELIEAYKKAYSDPSLNGIRGSLRTPNSKTILGEDLTPAEAFKNLLEWGKSQK